MILTMELSPMIKAKVPAVGGSVALGFALESVGRHVAGAASAGLRAESALFSVFETIRPKSLDHRASLVRVAATKQRR